MTISKEYKQWKCQCCREGLTSLGNGIVCDVCGYESCVYGSGIQREAPWADDPGFPKCRGCCASQEHLKTPTKSNVPDIVKRAYKSVKGLRAK